MSKSIQTAIDKAVEAGAEVIVVKEPTKRKSLYATVTALVVSHSAIILLLLPKISEWFNAKFGFDIMPFLKPLGDLMGITTS